MGREDARRLCQVSAIFTVHFHMSRSILYSQAFLFSLQSKVFPFRRKPRPAVLLKSTALCKQPEWLLAGLEALPAGRNPAPRASLPRSPGLGTMCPARSWCCVPREDVPIPRCRVHGREGAGGAGFGAAPSPVSCPHSSSWAPCAVQGRRRLQRHRGQQQLPRLAAAVSITASLLWLEISLHLQ